MSGQQVSRPPAPPRPPANPPTRQPAANPPTPVLFAYITGIKPVILIHRPPFRHTRALRSTAVAPGTANTPIHPALPRTGGWNPPRSPPAHRQYPVPRRLDQPDAAGKNQRRPPPPSPRRWKHRRRAAGKGAGGGDDIISAHLWLGRPRATSQGGLRPSLRPPRQPATRAVNEKGLCPQARLATESSPCALPPGHTRHPVHPLPASTPLRRHRIAVGRGRVTPPTLCRPWTVIQGPIRGRPCQSLNPPEVCRTAP